MWNQEWLLMLIWAFIPSSEGTDSGVPKPHGRVPSEIDRRTTLEVETVLIIQRCTMT